jgi:hypothetical protein
MCRQAPFHLEPVKFEVDMVVFHRIISSYWPLFNISIYDVFFHLLISRLIALW